MRLSLRRLLLLTLVTLTVGGAASVGIISYRAARQSLEREAVRLIGLVAENRRMSLLRTVSRQRERLARMLTSAVARCAAVSPPDTADACFSRATDAFASFESATAARLTRPGHPPIVEGEWHDNRVLPPNQLASIHREPDGDSSYVLMAADGDVRLAIELPVRSVQHIFSDRTGLGEHGETFLVDHAGRPLTPMLDESAAEQSMMGSARHACLEGASGEILATDYRGMDVIHGFRPMPEFGGGCVMAHIGQDEAFAAAAALGRQLAVTIVLIAIAGVILSVYLASRIGAPIRRLQASARRLQAGDFDTVMHASGPAEIRDLTEAFQAMTRSLRESHESLEAANRLKDEFLATLSHELRTPLNAIVGWAALLRAAPADPRRLQRGLDVIERNAKAQADLVSDLLDMSRVIRGTLQLRPASLDLADVVRAAIDTVRPAADAKSITFSTELAPCPTAGDAGRLQQVVWNLLSNAVKFTPHGGTVRIALSRAGSEAQLVVSDSGPGIPPAFLPYVFEPFRQADAGPARAHGGLGLGLAIVRRLVQLHGGSVAAENGQVGARFTVRLPLTTAPVEALSPSIKDHSTRRTIAGVRVLAVEDHDDTRELVATILREHGAVVFAAPGTREAMDLFETTEFDVLVADIGMPDQDGYTLMRWIRSRPADHGGLMPAIALTAYARAEDRAQALAAGFTRHLAKPVDGGALVSAIAALSTATSA